MYGARAHHYHHLVDPVTPHPHHHLCCTRRLSIRSAWWLSITHVALKQELEATAQHQLQCVPHFRDSLQAHTEARMRELYDKSARLKAELGGAKAAQSDLLQVCADIKELAAVRRDLPEQELAMTQDLARMTADAKRVPALRADVEAMKQELQCARGRVDVNGEEVSCDGSGDAEASCRVANAEKRTWAAAAAGNPGQGYNANYGNTDAGYAGNPYPDIYGMNPPGVENFLQYEPGPAAWGAYDMQQAQGH